jgi:cytochrome oxidase Cu insertion factor (SCO1/SenC/PrrC family)
MPGMGHPLPTDNGTVVAAFRTLLAHEALILLLVAVALLLAWNALMARRLLGAAQAGPGQVTVPVRVREHPARLVLRLGFGGLWVLDGLLQLQSGMPLGMPGNVVQPAASSSPGWVQHLVNIGLTIWNNHPVEAAAATVWIQLGIGLLLLVAPPGLLSRFAGAASVVWGLVVWIFGEAFGGIFGTGASWMFGTPGAVLLYCAAGVLLALPERAWEGRGLGRGVLTGGGVYLMGMAVLQAWPGRGFWQGAVGHHPDAGQVASMATQMASTAQPHWLSSWLSSFAGFDSAHGFAVNLFVVLVLALAGAALCSGRRRLVLAGLVAAGVLALADWVVVQDLGFLGGTGTDPNSMIPTLLPLVAGYVSFVRPAPAPVREAAGAQPGGRAHRFSGAYLAGVLGTVAAITVAAVGAIPMAAAAVNPNADPLLAEAADGTPNFVDTPAPAFTLTDQHGIPVSLAALRGRTVALTFLDPVCTSDCPLIAQEMREADSLLGRASGDVELVAVVANPVDRAIAYLDAFDQQEDLAALPNWLYLTGTVSQLAQVWQSYGVQVEVVSAGAMVAHSDVVYLIDSSGQTREVLSFDPGVGPAAKSSFSVYLSQQLTDVMHQ